MQTNLTRYLPLVLISFCLGSCDSTPQTKNETQTSAESKPKVTTEAPKEELVKFILPSTVQIGQIFRRAGLRYVEGVTNPVTNLPNYTSKVSKMLAYGAYSTDLSYCVLNDQSQEALRYLSTLETLSEEIGFSEVYKSKDLFERFEDNLGQRDSIVDIMIEIQERTDYFVEDYEMDDEALIVFIGAWVEGMYIGVKATNELNKKAISLRLLEQMTILDNLLLGLEKQKKNKEVDKIYDQLKELRDFFENIEEVKNLKKSIIELEISFTNLTWIAEKIHAVRTEIIK